MQQSRRTVLQIVADDIFLPPCLPVCATQRWHLGAKEYLIART